MTDLSSLGSASLGLWTRAQALALLSAGEVDGLVRRGTWQVPWRGVYADAGHVLDAEQRAFAAVLAAGGAGQPVPIVPAAPDEPPRRRLRAVACGRTAARVWQFPLVDDDDPATQACEHLIDHVCVWRHVAPQQHLGRMLRPHELLLRRGDLVRRTSGLWLTGPLRTLVDCATLLTHEALVCALDDALHRALVRPTQLVEAVEARKGDAGGPAFRAAVALADGRAEAPTETLARLLLLPVLPSLEPQVELFDRSARLVARFDLGDRRVRLAVEADGVRGHAGTHRVAQDRRRDRKTGAYGWHTERTTWFELRRQQQPLQQQRVVAAHAALSQRAIRPA